MLAKHFLLFLSIFLCTQNGAASQIPLTYTSDQKVVRLGNYVSILKDDSGALTLRDILADTSRYSFVPSTVDIPKFGDTRSAIWCRFTIENKEDEALYLELRRTILYEVDLYLPTNSGGYSSVITGSIFPRHTRDIEDNFFLFRLPPNPDQSTYYLRVKSITRISLPLYLGSARYMFAKHRNEEIIYGIFMGLFFALILYNLFLFFGLHDKNYIYYVLYLVLSLIVYDSINIGLGAEFLWGFLAENHRYILAINTSIGLFGLTSILFINSMLDIKEKLPKLYNVSRGFIMLSVIFILFNVFDFQRTGGGVVEIYSLSVSSYLFVLIIIAYLKQIKIARFLLIGWGVYLISVIIYIFQILSILPYNTFTINCIMYGATFEAMFLSLALADRIRQLRKEKVSAERENLKIVREQKETLERLVKERTEDIVLQHEEIAAQNEELLTQQDQIQEQNQLLLNKNSTIENAHQIIEKQHQQLIHHSNSLELEVAKRAKELLKSNHELIEQNHQLEQFSFITAHNLRAPVARIIGLSNVLKLQPKNSEENEFILRKVVDTSKELDAVIHDLTKILEIKKGSIENFEKVNLQRKINRATSLLLDDINSSKAEIQCDFENAPEVFALPQYIESIFLNLLSNAIKYKSPERRPFIKIRSWREPKRFCLSVKDNGIGLDTQRYKNKLFGLYQRFHNHVEGKGIGLHLVKTQVEALGGQIEVHSKLQGGTTFIITLPTKPSPNRTN